MFTFYYTLIGIVTFFIAALILGAWLRGHRTKENTERSSRVMLLLVFKQFSGSKLILSKRRCLAPPTSG